MHNDFPSSKPVFERHLVLKNLCVVRKPTNRPVSSRSGKTPHLNCAKCDVSLLDKLENEYLSVPKSLLNCLYVLNLETVCILADQFSLCNREYSHLI